MDEYLKMTNKSLHDSLYREVTEVINTNNQNHNEAVKTIVILVKGLIRALSDEDEAVYWVDMVKKRLKRCEGLNNWGCGSSVLNEEKHPNIFSTLTMLQKQIKSNSIEKEAIQIKQIRDLINGDELVNEEDEKAKSNKEAKGGAKIGRPRSAEFISFVLMEDKDEIMRKLHKVMDGRKGKGVMEVIRAAMQLGMISFPQYTSVVKEFNVDIKRNSYSQYKNNMGQFDYMIEPIIKALKEN